MEAAFERTFGRHVHIIVRGAADWSSLACRNPFPDESLAWADRVAVRVMRKRVPAETITALRAYVGRDERMETIGGDIWIFFSRDTSGSRLLAATSHKRLGIGTSRNWNTVRKLAEMVGSRR